MDLKYVNEFLVLWKLGNYHKAANELNISQSTLSKRIRKLEDELGVSLFDRSVRRTVLSEAGKLFLHYADKYLCVQNQCTQAIEKLQSEHKETLTIGMVFSANEYNLTELLIKFRNENPDCLIDLQENSLSKMRLMLRHGLCDYVFLPSETESDEEFLSVNFASDHLVAMLPANHPLAQNKYIQIEQLNGENILFSHNSTLTNKLFTNTCRRAGFEPNIKVIQAGYSFLCKLLSTCSGLALIEKIPSLHIENSDFVILDIYPPIRVYINILYMSEQELSAPAQRFLRVIKCLAAENVSRDNNIAISDF